MMEIIASTNKEETRALYMEAFDDPEIYVDYYYKEKCRDNTILVCKEKGEVVSMLHLNPYVLNICGKAAKCYYVVAVATKKSCRRQGYMAKVFEKAFELMKNEHIPFCYLMPVDEKIYSWMGFEKICNFSVDTVDDYSFIQENYDIYCVRDKVYLDRMEKEAALSLEDNDYLPSDPVIMAKITDLDAFCSIADNSFSDGKEALNWLRQKKIYICEEV